MVASPDDNPGDGRLQYHPMPMAAFAPSRERSWDSAVLAEGAYPYVYGYEARDKEISKRQMTVARVPVEKVGDGKTWCFWTRKE